MRRCRRYFVFEYIKIKYNFILFLFKLCQAYYTEFNSVDDEIFL